MTDVEIDPCLKCGSVGSKNMSILIPKAVHDQLRQITIFDAVPLKYAGIGRVAKGNVTKYFLHLEVDES
jgi:hypothetical protein